MREGFSLAYQTVGEGTTDPGSSDAPEQRSHLGEKSSGREVIWDEPSYAHILWGLASRRRLNRLGTVDWVPQIPPPLDALRTPDE
jgi:hypothetical protein